MTMTMELLTVSATELVYILYLSCRIIEATGVNSGGSERVRLVSGQNRYEGRVEVNLQSSIWTPVCQSGWNLLDANILCKELGRPGAMVSGRDDNALGDDERGRIYRVDCDEDSESITQCEYEYNSWCPNAATAKCNYDGYLGCYNDDDEFPALPEGAITIDKITIQFCLDHCRSLDMHYAGLGPPNNCYCGKEGVDYEQHGYASNSCLERCEGDVTQVCGGDKAIAVYTTTLGACGGEMENSGTLYSPGFPGQILQKQSCSWNISTPAETVIELKFGFKGKYAIDSLFIDEIIYGLELDVVLTDATVLKSCSKEIRVRFSGDEKADTFALEFNGVAQHCMTPPALAEGYRDRGHFDVTDFCPLQGRNVSIKCITGYNLTSAHDTITCLENREWNDTFPKCSIIHCGDPGNVDNASREGTSYTYQSIVKYTCHDGFTGEDSITCTANGNWTEKPSCKAINCGDIGNVDKAKREGTSYTYQSIVHYTCHDGFTGEGSITCTANGNWTEKPSCTASSSFGAGPLAGILIAVIVLICIVVVCVVFTYKRNSKRITKSTCLSYVNSRYEDIIQVNDNTIAQTSISGHVHSYEMIDTIKNSNDRVRLDGKDTPNVFKQNAFSAKGAGAIDEHTGETIEIYRHHDNNDMDKGNQGGYINANAHENTNCVYEIEATVTKSVDSSPNRKTKSQVSLGYTFASGREVPNNDTGRVMLMTENVAYELTSETDDGSVENILYEANSGKNLGLSFSSTETNKKNLGTSDSKKVTNNREPSHCTSVEAAATEMVENVAHQSAGADEDDIFNMYAEIDDTRQAARNEYDAGVVVDNILYESGKSENTEAVEYYVLEGP